tara:strand:- start:197 stop:385 length:189 start_codon:yes stop_codon:yes gene_type:complete
MALSKRIMKLLKQKYGKRPGVKVGDASKIRKQLGGTQVSSYRAKDGGYIVKKKKKIVKKRKK